MRIALVSLWFLLQLTSFTQEKPPSCEVYMVDIATQQAIKDPHLLSEADQKKVEASTVRILGRFTPDLREESLTTRSFAIPESNRFVTASVYSTDEMLPPASVSLALVISSIKPKSAFLQREGVEVDSSFNGDGNIMRLKREILVNKKWYLIGVQCQF